MTARSVRVQLIIPLIIVPPAVEFTHAVTYVTVRPDGTRVARTFSSTVAVK